MTDLLPWVQEICVLATLKVILNLNQLTKEQSFSATFLSSSQRRNNNFRSTDLNGNDKFLSI